MSGIYIIGGTTASGKSDLALAWARELGGVVLSCDSVQFYRGMDIGSAKLRPDERGGIPHYGFDLSPVDDPWDVGRFTEYAQTIVSEVIGRGQPVVVCGGSGFYLATFFRAILDPVEIPDAVREEVRAIESSTGLGGLVAALRKATNGATEPVDLRNPRRVVRALERVLATGKTPAVLRAEVAERKGPFDAYPRRALWLDQGNATLLDRITRRSRKMVTDGLVDEVRQLLRNGLEENPSARNAVGYRETIEWIRSGESDPETLALAITGATWKLVRRQRSWFRNQFPGIPRWIPDPTSPPRPSDAPEVRS